MTVENNYCEIPVNPAQTPREENIIDEILRLKKEKNAVILGHYYTRPEIQELADYVGDSLALAQIAAKIDNPIIIMCGVHFMAETTKILCPDRKVLIPDPTAGCSLADSCPADKFAAFVADHPGYTVISYVNTSAAVKAVTDVVVTSSNAKKIVDSFPLDQKIIFGPDRNLGGYINRVTGRNMLLWDGACHVHARFSADGLKKLKARYADADVLAHPECPATILDMADMVGSTAAILDYARKSDKKRFIIVTEPGILFKMQQECPEKEFIPVPANDDCACNKCEYMKQITLENLVECLRNEQPEVTVDPEIARRAVVSIKRMLEMSK